MLSNIDSIGKLIAGRVITTRKRFRHVRGSRRGGGSRVLGTEAGTAREPAIGEREVCPWAGPLASQADPQADPQAGFGASGASRRRRRVRSPRPEPKTEPEPCPGVSAP